MASPAAVLLVLAALCACARSQTTYSSLPKNYYVNLSYILNGVNSDPCQGNPSCLPEVSIPDGDAVIISYSPIDGTANTTSTITLQACYNTPSTQDRPWRKPNNVISKDKQCTVSVAKGLGPQGNFTYFPNDNTSPAGYFIQVLEVCSGGQYCGMARSVQQYTIVPIDSRPAWLMVLVGVFCCVGPFSLAAFFVGERYMKKRQ